MEVTCALGPVHSFAPAQGLGLFGLAERFKQADAVAVGIQAIDVVQHHRDMPVLVSQEVNTQRSSSATTDFRSGAGALSVKLTIDGACSLH